MVTVLATAVCLAMGQAAWAVPSLQLTFEEADNMGSGIVYDPISETTIISADGPAVLTLYAQSSAFHTNAPSQTAYLTFNLDRDVFGEFDNPNGITVLINGVQVAPTWTWGTPPLDGMGDLPYHGEFPAWFAEMPITFNDSFMDIPDVQTGEITTADGYAEEITIEVLGGATLHLDLYTLAYDRFGESIDDEIYAFAPFSHDAGITGIPEPATLAMFLTGGLVALRTRRRGATAGVNDLKG